MLYHVRMDVKLPLTMAPSEREQLKDAEKARAIELQRSRTWIHLWRIVGEYANISIFDVPDHTTLHEILSTLPLFPFMIIAVTPLVDHPSAIANRE